MLVHQRVIKSEVHKNSNSLHRNDDGEIVLDDRPCKLAMLLGPW